MFAFASSRTLLRFAGITLAMFSKTAAPSQCVSAEPQSPDFIHVLPAGESEGAKLLKELNTVYRVADALTIETEVRSEVVYRNRKWHESRRFRIRLNPAGHFIFSGLDSNGLPIVFGSDNKQVKITLNSRERIQAQDENVVQNGLFELSGITLQSSVLLPSFILGVKWRQQSIFLPKGRLLDALASKAELAGEATIAGVRCNRVICVRQIATWEIYLDASNSRVMRIVVTSDKDQIQFQRNHAGGGSSGEILETSYTHDFAYLAENATVPKASNATEP